MKVLVTGATGNVGGAVVQALNGLGTEVHAAGRTEQAPLALAGVDWHLLDLERGLGLDLGDRYDSLFLVRPPQIADPAPFEALLRSTSTRTRVVFLSVQGAGGRPWLPHAKIEKAILQAGFQPHFLRAGYFMENLTTTLHAVEIVNTAAGVHWRYESPSALRYVHHARRHEQPWIYVMVQLMLHWLPKFTGQDPLTHEFQALMGREPLALRAWALKHRDQLHPT